MQKKIKIVVTIIFIININLLSGCWDYRTIDNLGIVTGVAVDKAANGKDLLVTFEVVKTEGGKESKTNSQLIKIEGKTMFDAVRNAIEVAGRKLYFSHSKILIVSNEIAKEGVAGLLDFFLRHVENRRDIGVYISKEKSAGEVLEQKSPLSDILSMGLDEMQGAEKSLGKAPAIVLWSFVSDLETEGISGVLPTIRVNGLTEKAPQIDGTAVFKKDQLKGYLNGDETVSLLFAQDMSPGGIIVIVREQEFTKVSLEVSGSKTDIKPEVKDGKVMMNLNINIEATIGEDFGPKDYMSGGSRSLLEDIAEEQIEGNITALVKKVQNEFDSDIFGFGKELKKDKPEEWRKMKDDWDNLFKQINVQVNADVKIKNTGLEEKPIEVR